jgi:hypothetical protein
MEVNQLMFESHDKILPFVSKRMGKNKLARIRDKLVKFNTLKIKIKKKPQLKLILPKTAILKIIK